MVWSSRSFPSLPSHPVPLTKLPQCSFRHVGPFLENKQRAALSFLDLTFWGLWGLTPVFPDHPDASSFLQSGPLLASAPPLIPTSLPLTSALTLMPFSSPLSSQIPHIVPHLAHQSPPRSLQGQETTFLLSFPNNFGIC